MSSTLFETLSNHVIIDNDNKYNMEHNFIKICGDTIYRKQLFLNVTTIPMFSATWNILT